MEKPAKVQAGMGCLFHLEGRGYRYHHKGTNNYRYFKYADCGGKEGALLAAETYRTEYLLELNRKSVSIPEGFRAIPDLKDYAVSKDGKILKLTTKKAIKPTYGDGYARFNPTGSPSIAVHRCVARAWLPSPPTEKTTVNHLDGDKTNNQATNLEWVTPKENAVHAVATGLKKSTLGKPGKPVESTDTDGKIEQFDSIAAAARSLGVAAPGIHTCLKNPGRTCKNRTWRRINVPNIEIDEETWRSLRQCDGYEFSTPYEVSSLGRIKGKYVPYLSPKLDGKGYLAISLRVSERTANMRYFYVHRLVAMAFLGEPSEPDMVVNHKDEDKSNNAVTNLEWVTQSQNSTKAVGVAVEQRTLEGELVAEFPSIKCAEKGAGLPKGGLYRQLTSGKPYCGFLWVRQKGNGLEQPTESKNGPKPRLGKPGLAVEQRSLGSELIAEFPSIREAAKCAHIDQGGISKALKSGKPYRGFLWVRQEPPGAPECD